MSVFGIALVRDEADIIEDTIRWMLSQVDAIIVKDNGSIDGTLDILHSFGAPVEVLRDSDPAHYQSRKTSEMAAMAAREDADWVVPFDADEIWYSPFGRIADVLPPLVAATAPAAIYNHRATAKDAEGSPVARMGWRGLEALPLQKVACRPSLPVTIAEGNHGAAYPPLRPVSDQLIVRHLPVRTVAQFIRKARNGGAALAATTLPEDVGAHWRGWSALTDEQLEQVFYEHYWSKDPAADPSLIFDPAPCALP